MLTSYSRVTVVSGTRRVDLALPSALPVADVVPQVLRLCAPEESPENPVEFTLAKLGGQPITLSQSLAEAGVHDGDVIELRSFSQPTRPAFVEDVRDAIEDSVDASGGRWTSRSTVTFAIGATGGVLLLVLLAPLVAALAAVLADLPISVWDPARSASGLVAAALLVGATWVGTRFAAPWVGYLASAVAAGWAFAAVAQLLLHGGQDLAAAVTAGLAAASVVGLAARLASPAGSTLLAATTVLLAAAVVVLVATSLGAGAGVMIRLVATIAVLSVGVMPRVSIAVGGLSSADYRVRNAGRLSDEALAVRLRESQALLLGALYGVALLVAAVGSWLGLRPDAWGHDLWDGLLSVSLAAALALRSRVFSRTTAMLPLRVAAVTVLLAIAVQLAGTDDLLATWLAAAIAGVGALGVAVSVTPLSDITRARIKRALNIAEFIVIVDLVVVTMGAVTLYDWMGGR